MAAPRRYVAARTATPALYESVQFGLLPPPPGLITDPGARIVARIAGAGPWVSVPNGGLIAGVDTVVSAAGGAAPWVESVWTGLP